MKQERLIYILIIVALIGVFTRYYVTSKNYVSTLENYVATQEEVIDAQSENLNKQEELIERMCKSMGYTDGKVRTTTMTHEERKEAAGDATSNADKIQRIASALLVKIREEKKAENESNE